MVSNNDVNRRLNDFARRSFLNIADKDYIAARMAVRAELMPQFLWASQQAIEKYLKFILLVNRIEAKVGHDIAACVEAHGSAPLSIGFVA
ncbi:HEPN domain-containing protein [Roseateles sp. BYS96W]|uniref:HEPN domain-containing protein n=1 Tax=Pelomonas nitida TaxID=3299027 RepID=A0ABW7G8A5_9BURK